MGVWGVAGGHAPTSLEPAEAAFNRVARWWGAGLRSQVPRAGEVGSDAPWHQPGAEGIAVIGPVGNQTGQRRRPSRISPGSGLGCGRGADRPLGADTTTPTIRYPMHFRTETASATAERGIRLFFGARRRHSHARTIVLSATRRTDPVILHGLHQARASVAPNGHRRTEFQLPYAAGN